MRSIIVQQSAIRRQWKFPQPQVRLAWSRGGGEMKSPTNSKCVPIMVLLVLSGLHAWGNATRAAEMGPTYAGLQGEVLLDNHRVIVQKFIVQPGQSTGRHTRPG